MVDAWSELRRRSRPAARAAPPGRPFLRFLSNDKGLRRSPSRDETMHPFSFSFSGDDIENDESGPAPPRATAGHAEENTAGAFPTQGKPLLPAVRHELDSMLSRLPSKIAFGLLEVDLDGHGTIQIPRRELWDVRVQLMAEEDELEQGAELEPGLGKHDVKTGIYEGGFKSWESSVDLVKVLASEGAASALSQASSWMIELGCGTALPSLAMFQWACAARRVGESSPLVFTLADYNPSVLHLVTLPNFILAWAFPRLTEPRLQEAVSDGELELTPEIIEEFRAFLESSHITLSFLSGAWSQEFLDLLYQSKSQSATALTERALVLGAETIYSPFALASFTETLLAILRKERDTTPDGQAAAMVAAKRVYFGVGGSLDDFVSKMQNLGASVEALREESYGVRRGVVRCSLP